MIVYLRGRRGRTRRVAVKFYAYVAMNAAVDSRLDPVMNVDVGPAMDPS
jgi:hypothetical protein